MTSGPAPPPSRRSVRRAHRDDAAELARLHAESFAEPWSEAELQALLESALTLALVAPTEHETLGGFVLARRIVDEAEILTIAVDPLLRRSGIARNLLTALITQLRFDLPCRLFLEVSVDNAAAIALYEQSDFSTAGIRKGYYAKAGSEPVDGLTMALTIIV